MKIRDKILTILYIIGFFLSATIGILCLSRTTSPLFDGYGGDSAIFQTIGKYWTEGVIPYIELFDHKGPMIFLIDALGYWFAGNKMGIIFIEILFMFSTELIAFYMLKKCFSEYTSVIIAIIFPFLLIHNWDYGNLTEEYILPFLMISYAYMLHWTQGLGDKSNLHPISGAFIYGISFGFALMTRVTNAIGIVIGVVLIATFLLIRREWKNVFSNAGMFFFRCMHNCITILHLL